MANINIDGFIKQRLAQGSRLDGRPTDEYRPISIEYGVSAKSAEGSARVKIGETEVVAGVKLGIEKPYPDRPDEGSIMVNAELLPLSSPDYEAGAPGVEAIELSRVVDRAIRESKSIDVKKLCIEPGEKIWMIYIDIYTINDAGNVFDAAALAAVAALKDAVFPAIDKETGIVNYEKTKEKLPLVKTPISVTVVKVGNNFLVDPTTEEEKAAEARLMVATADDKHICAMQKGGDATLSVDEINDIVAVAVKKRSELAKHLEVKK